MSAPDARSPVFINGRFLTQPLSGVQRYAREIVRALDRRAEAGTRYVLLTPEGAATAELNLCFIPTRIVPGATGHLWEQTALAWAARHGRLLSLGGAGPVLHPRQTVVVHDAAVFRHPEHFRPGYAAFHRLLGRTLATRARLITVSRFSQGELAVVLRRLPASIDIVPNGADHLGRIAPDETVLRALGLTGRPYFVAIGNLAPNKNIGVMVRALHHLPDPELRLVLVGAQTSAIFDLVQDTPDPRIILAGRRSDAEVAALLRQARALVFASLYEGFGIPPLEALAHDCPVIASDIPATRETCGDAAVYFPPTDGAALAEQMTAPPSPDRDRTERGRSRVALYSWDRSAEALDALLFNTAT